MGIALNAAALVRRGPEAIALAGEATDVLSSSPARLEHACALAGLGELLAAAGDRATARARLREALEIAHSCGSAMLEARVLSALRAVGARPRRARLTGPEALTPRERRVALMAADGLSNRQIGQALFVTVRTVEFRLRGAYRKLRIESRRELEEALQA